ncbi:MAG TPA: TadE/TadG family type IV pilus assembly protein [Blastocatellia bacterium]|nr:TadE/TadG family type IV pilus assembly protein [Blastocatellia bacterium]
MKANKRCQRGIQLIELAIAAPILMLLLAAMAEFRNYLHHYTSLAKATRAAARYLSAKAFTGTEKEKAKNVAVCGVPDSCGSVAPVLAGLSASNIEITSTGGAILPETVTVRIIGYEYQPFFDLGGLTGGGSWVGIDVSPSTTMRYLLEN